MNHRPLRPAVLALAAALMDPALSGAQSSPELVVGPARVGETVSYRITVAEEGAADGDTAPRTGTVTITWKNRTRYLARVGSDSSSVVLAREAGGTLAMENMNPHDPGMVELSVYLAYFDRTDDLVAAVATDGAGEAVLHVGPAQPRATSRRPADQWSNRERLVEVPVTVTRTRLRDGLSIDAIGTVKHDLRPSEQGRADPTSSRRRAPSGEGGPLAEIPVGGAPMGGRPPLLSSTTHVEGSAQFDAAGTLTHESWHESTEIAAGDGTHTIRRTVTIDIER